MERHARRCLDGRCGYGNEGEVVRGSGPGPFGEVNLMVRSETRPRALFVAAENPATQPEG